MDRLFLRAWLMQKQTNVILHAQSGHERMCVCNHSIPRQMFQAICAIRVPLFRMSDHLFLDARANLGSSTRGADLINSKHHNHTLRCFGAAGSIKVPFVCLFDRLHVTVAVLALQHSRGGSHAPETLYTCRHRFLAHFPGHNTLVSPGSRIHSDLEHAVRSEHFS